VRHRVASHLAILAVRPGWQGQGTGTVLLGSYHQALDRDRTPAYLEASDLRTRRLYLRHGYADHGPPIELLGGPLMYPIWRQPSPTPQPAHRHETTARNKLATLGLDPRSREGHDRRWTKLQSARGFASCVAGAA
jgi:GNAT superfamily N-acetyltransferase